MTFRYHYMLEFNSVLWKTLTPSQYYNFEQHAVVLTQRYTYTTHRCASTTSHDMFPYMNP